MRLIDMCAIRGWRSAVQGAVLGVAALSLVGCGGSTSNTAHLQGTVTIGGKPLPADAIGSVTFNTTDPKQGKSVSAPITNGSYDCPNAPLGQVKVGFSILQPTGPERPNERGEGMIRDNKDIVPASASAGIDLNITGDNSAQNFEL
jgi:hypothetical protein